MMKQLSILLALALLATALLACGGGGNTLFDAVRTEGSSIDFFIYDGETTRNSWVIGESRDALLDKLKSVPVQLDEDWTHDDITLPIYGFTASKLDGKQFQIAFSNGRAITQDGVAYRFQLDFAAVERDYAWDEDWFETAEAAVFPCGRLLLIENDTWRTNLMLPAPALDPPAGITAELTGWDGIEADVLIRNTSAKSWSFGTPFRVDVCVDGVWYAIPERMGEYAMYFTLIGYVVEAGGTWQETYDVYHYYDYLPAGQYRIVAYELAVDFTVE